MKTKEVLNTRQYISCIVIFKTFICACLTSERETIIHGRRYPAVIVMNEQVPPSCQDGLPALNRSGNQVNFVGVV